MANKIRFGLRNVKYAIYDSAQGSYGALVALLGAVSMTMRREGSDATDFYADDGIYFSFAGTNGGYIIEIEMAKITDEVRVALLGEVLETSGVQFEYTTSEAAEFALVFETQGNETPTAFTFYGCKASRIETSANTKGENPEVDTDTISVRVVGTDFTVGEEGSEVVRHAIQSHITKTAENATAYNGFLSTVAVPTA